MKHAAEGVRGEGGTMLISEPEQRIGDESKERKKKRKQRKTEYEMHASSAA